MSSDSIDSLVAKLADPEWMNRQAAARSLAQLGPEAEAALSALWQTLLTDDDLDVRQSVAEAIIAVQEDASELIARIVHGFQSQTYSERDAAAMLGRNLPAGEKERLLTELWGALQLLQPHQGQLIYDIFLWIVENTDDNKAIVTRILDNKSIKSWKKCHLLLSPGVRDALDERWMLNVEEILEVILESFDSQQPETRIDAIDFLADRTADIPDDKRSDVLQKVLIALNDEDRAVRDSAIYYLVEDSYYFSDSMRDTVLQALWRCLREYGQGGVASIQIGGDPAVDQLLDDSMVPDTIKGDTLLRNPEALQRVWSQDKEKILPLILEALENLSWDTRQAAAVWLGQQADNIPAGLYQMVADALLRRLDDEDADVLRSANAALQRLRAQEKDTTQDLVHILEIGDEPEQISAIKALVEKAGRQRTREPLRSLLQEWVSWIAYGNKPLLVETAAEQMSKSPFAVQPLVDELEKKVQPSDDLKGWIRSQILGPFKLGTDEVIALLEDKSDSCRALMAAASDKRWSRKKLAEEMVEALVLEELGLRQLEIHRSVARQLARMSDPRFFDPELQDKWDDIKIELNRHAVPVLARRLPREQDFDIRASMARTLGNVSGREAVEALAQAVVGEERTQTRRQELLSKYYLEPSKARSEEAALILRGAVDEAKRTLRILQGLNIAVFVVGLATLIGGLLVAFLMTDGTTRVAGVLAGVGGFLGVIVQLIRDPLNRIQNAMANLVQIETAFTSFIWELNLNGTYIQSQYVAEGILTDNEVAQTADRIENAMSMTMNLVAVYTEEGRQRIVTRINSLSPAVVQAGDVITIYGQHLQGDSSQKKERTGMIAINHAMLQVEDVEWDDHEVKFKLPEEMPDLNASGETVWVSLFIDGMETNALPLLVANGAN